MPPFLLYTPEDAAILRAATANNSWPVDPVPINAGPHAGKEAVNPSVLVAAQPGGPLEAFADLIALGDETAVNIAIAWPNPA